MVAATDTEAPRASVQRVSATLCVDWTVGDAKEAIRLVHDTEHIQSCLHGLDMSLKRQVNNPVWLCWRCVTNGTNNMSCFSLQLVSLTAPALEHSDCKHPCELAQTYLIYNAWCINSHRPCWRTVEPGCPRVSGFDSSQHCQDEGENRLWAGPPPKSSFEEGLQFRQWGEFSWVRECL